MDKKQVVKFRKLKQKSEIRITEVKPSGEEKVSSVESILEVLGSIESKFIHKGDMTKKIHFIVAKCYMFEKEDEIGNYIYEQSKVFKKLLKEKKNRKEIVYYLQYINDYGYEPYLGKKRDIDEKIVMKYADEVGIYLSTVELITTTIYSMITHEESERVLVGYNSKTYEFIHKKYPKTKDIIPKSNSLHKIELLFLLDSLYVYMNNKDLKGFIKSTGYKYTTEDDVKELTNLAYCQINFKYQLSKSWFLITEDDEDFIPNYFSTDTNYMENKPKYMNTEGKRTNNNMIYNREFIIPESGFIVNIENSEHVNKLYIREKHNFDIDTHYILIRMFTKDGEVLLAENFGNSFKMINLSLNNESEIARTILAKVTNIEIGENIAAYNLIKDMEYNIEIPYSWRYKGNYREKSESGILDNEKYTYTLKDISIYTRKLPEGMRASEEILEYSKRYCINIKEGFTLVRPFTRKQKIKKNNLCIDKTIVSII